MSASVNENSLALQQMLCHFDLVGARESGLSVIETQVRTPIDLCLLAVTKAPDDLIFLEDNPGQVYADLSRLNAPSCGVAYIVGHLSSMDHGFRRRTPGVDAGTAQVAFLNQGYGPTEVSQLMGERIPRLP
jgi:hypothetical protein